MFGIEDVEKTCQSNKRLLLTNFVRARVRPLCCTLMIFLRVIKAGPLALEARGEH